MVDDDRRIRDLLSRFLTGEGYRISTADTAAAARAKLSGMSFDLLILDVMMPGETGFEFAKSIRSTSNVPILMLTWRATRPKAGSPAWRAAPTTTSPSRSSRVSCRCASPAFSSVRPAIAPPPESLRFGEFVFHIGRAELRKGDTVVRLTDREREMLTVLAATPGETVPRMALAGNGGTVNERAVDVQVNRLRRKIERDPANPLIIQTVRGIGYRLVVSP